MENNYILTLLLMLPLFGGLFILFLPKSQEKAIRFFGLMISIFTFIVSLIAYLQFNSNSGDFQLTHYFRWIEQLNISYFVGVDGMSLLLVLLTTFLTPLTLLSSWTAIQKQCERIYLFHAYA
jgi:NADH-quinone oxidoreductase subunit M